MRIAQIAPPWLRIPPCAYGGVENVVATLTDGLVERGHDVTLFACRGSRTSARLAAYECDPLGTRCQVETPLAALPHVLTAYARSAEFDVLHDHTFPFGPALAVARRPPPVILCTVHVPPAAAYSAPVYRSVSGHVRLVAVSFVQAASVDMRIEAVVHNGIRLADFPFRAGKEDFLLFLGRMSPAKGVHLAVETARQLGRRLLLAAKMENAEEIRYFDQVVRPLLTDDVTLLGEVDRARATRLLGAAACTLVPSRPDEPFGLVTVESLACGTPVVALGGGPADEIVDHGVTGFLAADPAEFAAFVPRVRELDPTACRRAAGTRFSAEVMVDAYEAVYRRAVASSSGGPGVAAP
jgi:glycosyltransferase involved in cell wall biosynthesis